MFVLFFFSSRRRHTRCLSDWSSDVCSSDLGKWEPYAIEINLRKGGTTHPFLTLQFLTDGTYNHETGIFTAPNGQQKFFRSEERRVGKECRSRWSPNH